MQTIGIGADRIEYAWFPANEGRPSPPADPIVFLHHGFGCVADWRDYPARVAAATGHPALVYSRRNCGGSSVQRTPRDQTYLHIEAREQLPRLLDALGIARCHLYGHSDGASIALIFAATFPDRTLLSAVEAPHVFAEPLTVRGVMDLAARYDASPALRDKLAKHHRNPDAAFHGWADPWRLPAFRCWSIEDELPLITTPLLVMQGSADPYGTMVHAGCIAARSGGPVEVIEVAGCGHSPHYEQKDQTLYHVTRFLAAATG